MAATIASDIRPGIGARLKAGRERMGMTLLQVAEKLHVDPKVLEALEAERYADLGAPVYVRGHLRHYSELVGENTGELLDQYSAATKPVLPDLTHIPKASQGADPRKLVLPSLVVLIAFALVGSVWWVLQNLESPEAFGKPAVPEAMPESSGVDAEAVLAEPSSGDTDPSQSTTGVATESASAARSTAPSVNTTPGAQVARNGAGAAGTPADRAATSDTPAAGSRPGSPAAGAATTAGTSRPAGTSATQGAAAASSGRGGNVNVTLKFAADSWVEVYDANGERLFYDIGSADSSRTLSGTPPLRVVLGNAPGVSLDINGRPATVPANVVRQDTAQFTINRSGRIVRARPEEAASAGGNPDGG